MNRPQAELLPVKYGAIRLSIRQPFADCTLERRTDPSPNAARHDFVPHPLTDASCTISQEAMQSAIDRHGPVEKTWRTYALFGNIGLFKGCPQVPDGEVDV